MNDKTLTRTLPMNRLVWVLSTRQPNATPSDYVAHYEHHATCS